eukprot:2199218-Pleurochrysis_carterae.AAC.1
MAHSLPLPRTKQPSCSRYTDLDVVASRGALNIELRNLGFVILRRCFFSQAQARVVLGMKLPMSIAR